MRNILLQIGAGHDPFGTLLGSAETTIKSDITVVLNILMYLGVAAIVGSLLFILFGDADQRQERGQRLKSFLIVAVIVLAVIGIVRGIYGI